MVPHIARRGHSFKGAGMYYLHDKQADTSERVAWTHTHNVPTQDPEKALRWMAYTAEHADQIKRESGVAMTGRKSRAGSVYSFSLSWHPEQKPEKEQMLGSAFETLELLGLKDHEAVVVAHQETEHPHIHVICNLVNPNDGKTAVPSYDRLTLSKWAEEKEKAEGKIYCEQRVENNQMRRDQAKENRQLALVKHREAKLKRAEEVQMIYNSSDSGKALNAALEEAGYTLAKGDRRGFVLVDQDGEIHSLSRQLKGQRAKDIRSRLSDLEQSALPLATTIADERRYFDRDQYEADWQKSIVDGAIEAEHSKDRTEKQPERRADEKKKTLDKALQYDDRHLQILDAKRALEKAHDHKRYKLEQKLDQFYNRKMYAQKLEELNTQIEKNQTPWARLTGKLQALEKEKEALSKMLTDIDNRTAEQKNALDIKLQQEMQSKFEPKDNEPKPDLEEERRLRIAAVQKQMRSQTRHQGLELKR